MRGLKSVWILLVVFSLHGAPKAHAALLKEDSSGVILVSSGPGQVEVREFLSAKSSGVFVQVTDVQGRVESIPVAKVSGLVRFLKLTPSELDKEDLDAIERKIEELNSVIKRAPQSLSLIHI